MSVDHWQNYTERKAQVLWEKPVPTPCRPP